MSTCSRLDLESQGSWPTMAKHFPGTVAERAGCLVFQARQWIGLTILYLSAELIAILLWTSCRHDGHDKDSTKLESLPAPIGWSRQTEACALPRLASSKGVHYASTCGSRIICLGPHPSLPGRPQNRHQLQLNPCRHTGLYYRASLESGPPSAFVSSATHFACDIAKESPLLQHGFTILNSTHVSWLIACTSLQNASCQIAKHTHTHTYCYQDVGSHHNVVVAIFIVRTKWLFVAFIRS